ncbi:Cochaperone protein [Nowakowskiella sp. JEL0078]|nr:Cochaperone protein [Nowakowskiella sp. JEL0078]
MSANELFAQGNASFVEESYEEALAHYTSAIAIDSKNPDFYLKRSIVHFKLLNYPASTADADISSKLAKDCKKFDILAKASLRKGLALAESLLFEKAKVEFDLVFNSPEASESDKKTAAKWIEKCLPFIPVPVRVETSIPAAEEQIIVPLVTEKNRQKVEESSNTFPSQKIRHEWFQNENFITIELFIKKVSPANVSVDFTPNSISVYIKLPTGSDFSFDLDPLAHEIIVEESKFSVMSTKIELKAKKKRLGLRWGILEGNESEIGVILSGAKDDKPAYPTSAKKRVDWTSVEKSVTEEKPEGEQALNALFQSIYKDANEDVRKAMIKSFTESGGTALSTNWDEVSKKKVEVTPPEGMVAKKYEM